MPEVNYKELQEKVNELNAACGTGIKVIGAKKTDLMENFKEAVKGCVEKDIPAIVVEYFKANFAEETVADVPDNQSDDAPTCISNLGNTQEELAKMAGILGVDVASLPLNEAEKVLLEKLDSFSQEQWDALPIDAQKWDALMTKNMKEKLVEKAKPKQKAGKTKPKVGEVVPKEPKKEKAPAGPIGPRPGWTFTEGTNAHQIMSIFAELFVASKGAGIALKDLQDACVKAKVKSGNVKNRVAVAMRYATIPEGGSQVVKVGGLYFPASAAPKIK